MLVSINYDIICDHNNCACSTTRIPNVVKTRLFQRCKEQSTARSDGLHRLPRCHSLKTHYSFYSCLYCIFSHSPLSHLEFIYDVFHLNCLHSSFIAVKIAWVDLFSNLFIESLRWICSDCVFFKKRLNKFLSRFIIVRYDLKWNCF